MWETAFVQLAIINDHISSHPKPQEKNLKGTRISSGIIQVMVCAQENLSVVWMGKEPVSTSFMLL